MNVELLVALISFASLVVMWALVPSQTGHESNEAEAVAPAVKRATA